MRTKIISFCCLLSLNACGNDGNGGIDRHIEDRLTISQGVYGQTTSQDDVGNDPVEYFSMEISVFQGDEGGPVVATVRSDDVGFFEIQLDPGAYKLCTSFNRCTQFRLESGECIRLDYEFSASLGWAEAKTTPCPT